MDDEFSQNYSFEELNELLNLSPIHFHQEDDNLVEHQKDAKVIIQPGDYNNTTMLNDNAHDGGDSSATGKKKTRESLHKYPQRQRRQDMAKLYHSLRLQLPVECLKGKRSSSDHVHEAVKYVSYMQKKTEKLNEKRDELLKRSLTSPTPKKCSPSSSSSRQTSVEVTNSVTGIQVLINTDVEEGVKLSGVLNIITNMDGLTVINGTSARVDSRILHTIDIQVDKGQSHIPLELQRRLRDLCN